MDDNTKRNILQTILSSQKIKTKYDSFRSKYRLNRKLIIKRIINEIDTLAKKFKDNIKLTNFLESFIVNHLKDFLIFRIKDTDTFSRDTTNVNEKLLEDIRIREDPSERFNRELEQRKQAQITSNTNIVDEINNNHELINQNEIIHQINYNKDNEDNDDKNQLINYNEDNNVEKNDINNLEMIHRNNNNNFSNNNNQSNNPYLANNNYTNQQIAPLNQQIAPMNQNGAPMNQQIAPMNQNGAPMNQKYSSMNQQGTPIYQQGTPIYQQGTPIYQQGTPINQQGTPINQQGIYMNQQGTPINQQGIYMNQQGTPINQQGTPINQQGIHMNEQMSNSRRIQMDSSSNGYTPNKNVRRRNDFSSQQSQVGNVVQQTNGGGNQVGNVVQQTNGGENQVSNVGHQVGNVGHQVGNVGHQVGNVGHQVGNVGHQVGNVGHRVENGGLQNEQMNSEKDDTMDRSLIHIDSREREFIDINNGNLLKIQMNNSITCLVSIKDLIVSNVYCDPYLLVQILESPKSVYENQGNSDIHFKLVRVNSSRESGYFKNIDEQTMIRMRDISTITMNIIRPNGKILYKGIKDVYDVKVENRENAKMYIENSSLMTEMTSKMELIHLEDLDMVQFDEGDSVVLFDKILEDGCEFKVLSINKKDNKILLETIENRTSSNYSKILINKYQVAITLEII